MLNPKSFRQRRIRPWRKIKLTLPIFIILFIPFLASAAGLQISPSYLNFEVVSGKETSQKIIVANPTADVQIYEITADDFSDFIKSLPKSFTLESGERKEVIITIMGQDLLAQANQKITSNLSVVAKPLASDGLTVGTGAKVPIEIITLPVQKTNSKYTFWVLIVIVTVIFTTLLVAGFFKKKTKKNHLIPNLENK